MNFNVHNPNREDILSFLRNQTIQINGLQSVFSHWIHPIHPDLNWLRDEISQWIKTSFPDHGNLNKFLNSDFALFGAIWYPNTSKARLTVATKLAVWLFVWDDAADKGDNMDDQDFGLATEYEQAESFRETTYKYIKSLLGLSQPFTTEDNVIKSFYDVGSKLRATYSEAQRIRFLDTMEQFITQQRVEQQIRIRGHIPTIEEFWEYRLGTSAVKIAIEMNEYCNTSNLPARVLNDERMIKLCHNANVNFCAVNDLVSLRKEMKTNSIENIVPTFIANFQTTTQSAVNEVMHKWVKETITNIDKAGTELMRDYENDTQDLEMYLDGIRNLLVANMTWSLVTDRYGLDVVEGDEGESGCDKILVLL